MRSPFFLKTFLRHLRQPFGRGPHKAPSLAYRGILVFSNTSEVIAAERILRKAGLEVSVKGPPPDLQTGCDMVLTFPLLKQAEVTRTLHQGTVIPQKTIVETDHYLEPVSLFDTRDLGQWLMVRAANIKLTVDKKSGVIVNISGGGCPDVPWLAQEMVGKSLHNAPEPLSLGRTLCSYCLQKAYEEMKRIMPCG